MEQNFWGLGVVLLLTLGSLLTKKIDLKGALVGGLITYCLFLGASWRGIVYIGCFFILGTLASHWQRKQKHQMGLEEANKGRRSVRNVLSNAGVAALCGIVGFIWPAQQALFELMMAASLSAALGDTISSELGNVLGKRYYHIVTWQKGKRGADGVVSKEGSLAGFLASGCLALIGLPSYGFLSVLLIWGAGILGNVVDSLAGAMLQAKGYLNNHQVNLLNTLFAALFAGALWLLWRTA
mgnify:CR=1 FL=1